MATAHGITAADMALPEHAETRNAMLERMISQRYISSSRAAITDSSEFLAKIHSNVFIPLVIG